jgi:hypothetical protein
VETFYSFFGAAAKKARAKKRKAGLFGPALRDEKLSKMLS